MILNKKIFTFQNAKFFTFYSNELKAQKKREKKKKEIPGKTKQIIFRISLYV